MNSADESIRKRSPRRGFALALGVAMLIAGAIGGSVAQSEGVGAAPFPANAAAPLPPGGWRLVHSPSPRVGATLESVSCATSTFCVAAGLADSGLIEEWNGATWSIVPSPSPGTGSALMSVSCASTTFCAAVGSYGGESSGGTLIDLWNGHVWTWDKAPNLAAVFLTSVSCPTSTFCAAVGQNGTGAVIATWNGTDWRLAPSPALLVPLDGVSCASSSFCMAVGESPDCNIPGAPGCFPNGAQLAEVWNGTHWMRVPMPRTAGGGVHDVSCTNVDFCLAGGNDGIGLVEAWDGRAWRVVRLPDASSIADVTGVGCASPTACTLVPASLVDGTLVTARIEYWNGDALRAVRAPHLAAGQLDLVSVAVVGQGATRFQVAVGGGTFSTVPFARTAIAMHD
jgi:hypothetical protein